MTRAPKAADATAPDAPDDPPSAAAPDHAARLDAVERQLGELAATVADLVAAHRSHAGHLRHIDRAADAIANAARDAVEAARHAAREQRLAAARERAGERVRVRAIRPVDLWVGPRSERVKLDPANLRGDSARLLDRSAWAGIVERSDEVRAALESGAISVEALSPDEAAALEAR